MFEKLRFLFSKKILIILSGLIFTGVAAASSGAESLFQGASVLGSESKIPDVAKIEEGSQGPTPSPKPVMQSPAPVPSASYSMPAAKPSSAQPGITASAKPTPKASSSTQPAITGLGKTDDAEDKKETEDEKKPEDDSEINQAFQKAKEED